jgi:hypothetical protein
MAGVNIDSGALSPTYRFADIPKARWKALVREKRNFLATNIKYDCRCLIEFCEEANVVWQELGYESSADMIRNGYELDPQQIELAVSWLKINEPQIAVGLGDIVPLRDPKGGRPRKDENLDNIKVSNKGGTDTDYTLRRLARDAPEMLDKIEAGELSVNAAAIKAGIRKKPTKAEVCVAAFRKAENRLEVLRMIASELEPHEAAVVRDWITERMN